MKSFINPNAKIQNVLLAVIYILVFGAIFFGAMHWYYVERNCEQPCCKNNIEQPSKQ